MIRSTLSTFTKQTMGRVRRRTSTKQRSIETKQIARDMMRMRLAIDKDSFEGNREVTCYSCHKGLLKPDAGNAETRDTVRHSMQGLLWRF